MSDLPVSNRAPRRASVSTRSAARPKAAEQPQPAEVNRGWAPKGVRAKAVAAPNADTAVTALRSLADRGETLRTGSRGPDVVQLQSALKLLGYPVDADGTFGKQTAAAVKEFLAHNGSPHSAGTSVGPDLSRLMANQVDRSGFSQSIGRLSNALMTDNPKFFEDSNLELRQIQAEPNDAKRAAHLEAWQNKLTAYVESRSGALDSIAPGWRADFSKIATHFQQASGSQKAELAEGQVAAAAFREAATQRVATNIGLVADSLNKLDPALTQQFMSGIDSFESADGDVAKTDAFRATAKHLGQLVNSSTEKKMSPEARRAWLELRGTFNDAERTGNTKPMADFMQQTYLRHTLDSIQVSAADPKQVQMTDELRQRVSKLEGAATAQSPRGGALTPQMLQAIVPGLAPARAAELTRALTDAMDKAQITTPRQKAAFIAQCAEETGGFKWFHELGKNSYFAKYDNRADLGNRGPPDGATFKGRGALMVTGRSNYTAFSQWETGSDALVKNSALLEQPKYAFDSAAWYWSTHGLNKPAENNDFKLVTERINGGTNGWDARLRYYSAALAQFAHG